jgi:uncharacterized protein DUF3455
MNPLRKSILAAATLAAAVALAPAAQAGPVAPGVPGDIAVPAGHKPFLVGHATGVQIYPCLATATGYAWGASTPRATLAGDNGKVLAEHFGGPSWQARDGSLVVGRRDAGVTVDPTAIPWLRLTIASAVSGADGDRLTGTSYILRTATTGGLAPAASGCNAATAGTSAEVPYTADYTFFKPAGS